MMHRLNLHAQQLLSGIGQTFFAHDPLVGLLAVAALAVFAPHLAVSGLVAAIGARVLAGRAGASKNLIDAGIVTLNGWFAGLAAATFFAPGIGLAVVLALIMPLVVAATMACDRLLSPWQLPVLVAPYVPAFALIWLAFGTVPWMAKTAVLSLTPIESWPLALLVSTLRGIGQIFFTPDPIFGAVLLVVASVRRPLVGPAMFGAALAATLVAQALVVPGWQVEQGLHGFAPAMMAAAVLTRFKGLGWPALAATVVLGPVVELAVLNLGATLGVYGLSTSYVGIVWGLLLLSPVQVKSAQTGGWGALKAGALGNKSY